MQQCSLQNFCSGDQDSVIPLTGSRTLVQNLAHDMGLKTTTPYRVWFEGQQVKNTS
jgi:serine carboxypeptidase-like clade 2